MYGDVEVRPILRQHILTENTSEVETTVLEELGLCRGQSRVDLVAVNGIMHGFEIKSDRDSLRRLQNQVGFYSGVFDCATVVVGKHHLTKTIDIVPSWWGVLLILASPSGPRIEIMRRGKNNPKRDPRSLVELLWRDEAIALLDQRDASRGIRSKPRSVIWDRVCEHFDVDEIAAEVRARLKTRAAHLIVR